MKRFLIISAVVIASITAVIVCLIAAVPLFVPADELKAALIKRVSASTGREVNIGALKYNIFRGIELGNVSIMEPEGYGKREFIRDNSVILSYNLPAILSGNLVIDKIELDSPYCEIIKEKSGAFNFSSIMAGKAAKKEIPAAASAPVKAEIAAAGEPSAGKAKKPFIKTIIATGISVKNGKFAYADYSGKKASGFAVNNFNLSIEDIIMSAVKPAKVAMDFSAVSGRLIIPVSLKASVKTDLAAMSAVINIESLTAAGTFSTGKISAGTGGDISGNISTSAAVKKVLASLPEGSFKGINFDAAAVNNMEFNFKGNQLIIKDRVNINREHQDGSGRKTVENLGAGIKFSGGVLSCEAVINAYGGVVNFNLLADTVKKKYNAGMAVKNSDIHGFVGDLSVFIPEAGTNGKTLFDEIKQKVYGTLNMNCSFFGNTFSDVPHTIRGGGYCAVTDGKLSSLEMAKNLGTALGIDSLKNDLVFDILSGHFSMSGGKISTDDLKMQSGPDGKSGDIKLAGSGYTTVDSAVDFKAQMDFNPRVASKIGAGFLTLLNIKDASYAYNSDGWLPVDARVYNTIKAQKYDLKQPRMIENIKRNLGKKLREGGLEDAAKKLLQGIFN